MNRACAETPKRVVFPVDLNAEITASYKLVDNKLRLFSCLDWRKRELLSC